MGIRLSLATSFSLSDHLNCTGYNNLVYEMCCVLNRYIDIIDILDIIDI